MSIRPVDLQNILAKTLDVGREAGALQQQATAGQQLTAAQQSKHQQELTETVHGFDDETGPAAVNDREEQQRRQEEEQQEREEASTDGEPAGQLTTQQFAAGLRRLGRHIDLQA